MVEELAHRAARRAGRLQAAGPGARRARRHRPGREAARARRRARPGRLRDLGDAGAGPRAAQRGCRGRRGLRARARARSREPRGAARRRPAGAAAGLDRAGARPTSTSCSRVSDDPELAVKVAFSYLASRQLAEAAEVLDSARAAAIARAAAALLRRPGAREAAAASRKAAEAYGRGAARGWRAVPRGAAAPRDLPLARRASTREALELLRRRSRSKPDYLALYSGLRPRARAGGPGEGGRGVPRAER